MPGEARRARNSSTSTTTCRKGNWSHIAIRRLSHSSSRATRNHTRQHASRFTSRRARSRKIRRASRHVNKLTNLCTPNRSTLRGLTSRTMSYVSSVGSKRPNTNTTACATKSRLFSRQATHTLSKRYIGTSTSPYSPHHRSAKRCAWPPPSSTQAIKLKSTRISAGC